MKLYLGGPMRGIDKFNFPAFDAVANALRLDGHEVVSPAEHDREAQPQWKPESNSLAGFDMPSALAWDLSQILSDNVEAIAFLSGWEGSDGCQLELRLARMLNKPVYEYANGELRSVVQGSEDFHRLLTRIGALHDRKQSDYGTDADPFANVRSSQEWGIPPWVGALVRLNDKVHRLKQFAERGSLANESAEDSMMDIAVYALIALVLYREGDTATGAGLPSSGWVSALPSSWSATSSTASLTLHGGTSSSRTA